MQQQFNINGKNYSSLNDVPQEFKALFEDKNQNGIPDIFEGMLQNVTNVEGTTTYNNVMYSHNGKSYNNMDELPLDAKKKLLEKLNMLSSGNFGNAGGNFGSTAPSFAQPNITYNTTVTHDKPFLSTGVIVILAILFIGLLIAAIALGFLF